MDHTGRGGVGERMEEAVNYFLHIPIGMRMEKLFVNLTVN